MLNGPRELQRSFMRINERLFPPQDLRLIWAARLII